MDMYQMAKEQAENVKEMVRLLQSIEQGLKTVSENQVETYGILDQIEERLSNLEDEDDDLYDTLNFFTEEEEELKGCDCVACTEERRRERFENLEEIAKDDMNTLTSQRQLPYRFFNTTLYEFTPGVTKPIRIGVNIEKRTVVAMMIDDNEKVLKVGKARCAPNDDFSPWIGAAVATHRLFELPIPSIYL